MAIRKKFMINNSRLRYILTVDGLDYYSFKPSFRHWFFEDWDGYTEDKEKNSIRQRVRMFIEWIWGVLHLLCREVRVLLDMCW